MDGHGCAPTKLAGNKNACWPILNKYTTVHSRIISGYSKSLRMYTVQTSLKNKDIITWKINQKSSLYFKNQIAQKKQQKKASPTLPLKGELANPNSSYYGKLLRWTTLLAALHDWALLVMQCASLRHQGAAAEWTAEGARAVPPCDWGTRGLAQAGTWPTQTVNSRIP